MSFRNTFTTDFIYQAGEAQETSKEITAIFERWCGSTLYVKSDERGYGAYAGWFKTLSGQVEEAEQELKQIVSELEKVTKVPFRLTVLLESGPTITYDIRP